MPGIRIAMPAIMGLDVAGEIAAIGPGVTGWELGGRVLGDPINRVEGGLTGETVHGGLAEYCRLRRLLRMTFFLNAITNLRHPEEARSAVSKNARRFCSGPRLRSDR